MAGALPAFCVLIIFGLLLGCDAVRAVGPNLSRDADSGDLVVALTRTSAQADAPMSAEDLLPIPQGQSFLGGLRGALKDEFQVCGNHYWGTVTDCAAIF